MRVITDLSSIAFSNKTIVTIGTFDGVHLGHQKIINKLVNDSNHFESIIITFAQHPRMVIDKNNAVKLLNSTAEKIKILEKHNVDNLVILEFNQTISELSGEDFVKTILVDKLNIGKIIIGYDHKFGKNRMSDIHDLTNLGHKYHFDVEQISAEELNEIAISSTKIRNAVLEGNIKLANQYLGYTYHFSGIVVKGKQLGRTIDFPTANICIENPLKIIPKNGVYIVDIEVENELYKGMMNIGLRPTVEGDSTSIEVNIFDFEKDIYTSEVKVFVYAFIRNEQKFPSIDALKNQLRVDKQTTLDYFKNHKI